MRIAFLTEIVRKLGGLVFVCRQEYYPFIYSEWRYYRCEGRCAGATGLLRQLLSGRQHVLLVLLVSVCFIIIEDCTFYLFAGS